MKKLTSVTFLVLALGAGACGSSEPAANEPAASPEGSGGEAAAAVPTQPDRDKAVAHLQQHVQYPATREALLAACANTPEFSEAEKAWFAEHLPEGTYDDADAVIAALGI